MKNSDVVGERFERCSVKLGYKIRDEESKEIIFRSSTPYGFPKSGSSTKNYKKYQNKQGIKFECILILIPGW